MKGKYKRLVVNRIVVTVALILLQILWIVFMLEELAKYSSWITTAFTVLSIAIVLYIIGKDDYPYQRIRNFALKYNNSSRYADDVWKIYDEVSKLDENIKLLKKTNHNVSEELI